MTNIASASFLGSEFDAFLFAPIGRDKNEMMLSVVSALARLDVDPWQEAAMLAGLSQDAATSRLRALIAGLPGGPPLHFDPGTGVARLVALLPAGHAFRSPVPQKAPPAAAIPNFRVIVLLIVSAVFMFGAQYVIAKRQPSAPVEKASGTIPETAPAKTPSSSAP